MEGAVRYVQLRPAAALGKSPILTSGDLHASSGRRMTGIRSWTVAVTAFGVVVRMEPVFAQCPSAFFQPSHSPANASWSVSDPVIHRSGLRP